MRILALCGSLQAESTNLDLLRLAKRLAPPDVQMDIFDGLRDLPLFNPDIEGVPPAVAAWRDALSGSDAVLIATPEYGHSLPGGLKNAIDWVIGTGELERKIVALTASTVGPGRGQRGLEAVAVTLGAVSARIAYGAPIVRGAGFEAEVEGVVNALIAEVREAGTVEK